LQSKKGTERSHKEVDQKTGGKKAGRHAGGHEEKKRGKQLLRLTKKNSDLGHWGGEVFEPARNEKKPGAGVWLRTVKQKTEEKHS